jgi:organic hydroperoxide reductase OsmC/OhrA
MGLSVRISSREMLANYGGLVIYSGGDAHAGWATAFCISHGFRDAKMHPYPHVYVTHAAGQKTGEVTVTSARLPNLSTAPPAEFDGPGDAWSPETLLCAAVADCFVLTFRGVSRAGKLEWRSLECRVEGSLERTDGITRFTVFKTFAKLTVPQSTDVADARRLLERAEHVCLVANSLNGSRMLDTEVLVES